MSEGRAIPLAAARAIAEQVRKALAPACERIEIAGSVRRERPEVHDIEIVAIPLVSTRPGPPSAQSSLFGELAPPPMEPVNAIWEAIEALGPAVAMPLSMTSKEIEPDPLWAKKRTGEEGKRSKMFKIWLPGPQMRLDLFMPTVEGWGGVFTIRTGCAEFSEALVTRWKMDFGGSMSGGVLIRPDGRPVETPEEHDFFQALRVEWIPPRCRTGAAAMNGF